MKKPRAVVLSANAESLSRQWRERARAFELSTSGATDGQLLIAATLRCCAEELDRSVASDFGNLQFWEAEELRKKLAEATKA